MAEEKEIPEGLRADEPLEKFIGYLVRSMSGDVVEDFEPIIKRYVELNEGEGSRASLDDLTQVLFGEDGTKEERYEQVELLVQAIDESIHYPGESDEAAEMSASLDALATTMEVKGCSMAAREADRISEKLRVLASVRKDWRAVVGCPHGCANLTSLVSSILTERHPVNEDYMETVAGRGWLEELCGRIHNGAMTAEDLDRMLHEGLKGGV